MRYDLIETAGPDAPCVVLSSGLGGAAAFWRPQLPALASDRHVLAYDHRGTGRNPADLGAGTSIAAMAEDVRAIMDAAGVAWADFVGHALGGLIGLELARVHPARVRRLVVVNGWARPDPATRRCFDARRALLDHVGIDAYVRAQAIFLYPADYISAHADRLAEEEAHAIAHFPPVATMRARIDALLHFDIAADLARITAPALIACARDDVLVPWTCSRDLADGLPHATLDVIERGGHAFTVTHAEAFNRRLRAFLDA